MSEGGFFDDLLGAPRRRTQVTASELDVAGLVAGAVAAIDEGAAASVLGAEKPPRLHLCSRCERDAAKAEAAGELVIPPRPVERWKVQGRTYYGATCRECTDLEWSELWQIRYNRAEDKASEREMKRLVELAHARQKAGRRIHVALPAPAEKHAAYGAR